MEKEQLEPISKTKILKNELPDFEWYFVDITQLQKRIGWLKEQLENKKAPRDRKPEPFIRNIVIDEFLILIEEAFKEVKPNSSHD